MGDMDAKGVLKFLKLGNLSEHLSGYVENKLDLLKIELQEDGVALGAKLLLLTAMLILGLCCLLFVSIALAILLNNVLEHNFIGYFITAGVYFVLALTLFSLRNNEWVKKKLYGALSKTFNKTD